MPDLVFSSDQNLILDVLKLSPLGKSDHAMMLVTVDGAIRRPTTCEQIPDWKNADMEGLKAELAEVD